ncbi:LCP family protein [Streptomyces sp. NRRL F-5053]|uniref:LCP family protein n=1 Tax=Streptomyces sp. NRRL F-5053 TaxID=1463854 RepID=UPI0004C642A6|nr:LCP family protein [Streptomyces sp. NRRL F-5053]
MNDGYGYDPYGQQPQIVGYDEYGRPVYAQPPQAAPQQAPQQGAPVQPGQDPYAAQAPHPGYDPYAQPGHDPYAGGPGQGYPDPYAQQPGHQGTQQQEWFPQQSGAPQQEQYDANAPYGAGQQHGTQQQPYAGAPGYGAPDAYAQGAPEAYGTAAPAAPHAAPGQEAAQGPAPAAAPAGPGPGKSQGQGQGQGQAQGGEDRDYRTEQFSFVEEPDDDSEDVIDWLKFTESRTERREEARRRGRNRVVALVVALVLVVAGGVGYLWYAGMLPGLDGAGSKSGAAAGKQRDVIVVHLRETGGHGNSTALLVDNAGAGEGTTVLLPNSLAVTNGEGSTTTLGKSVEDEGAAPTREALSTLLGADIKGTWRLDTPYLENLVELVGGVALDTDATVPGKKKGGPPLVERGAAQDLDGRAAVAYATYRAQGEPQGKQLARFGQVMQAVLKKISSDGKAATRTVESLGQIPDPSLTEGQLGASLAKLAERAKQGDYRTTALPVEANGTLGKQAGDEVVKKVLGGTVKNSDPNGTLRVSLQNAAGKRGLDNTASAALVNGGYAVVDAGNGATRARSRVTYDKPENRAKAEEVAKTLGLGAGAVQKGSTAANADVAVVLGADYKG